MSQQVVTTDLSRQARNAEQEEGACEHGEQDVIERGNVRADEDRLDDVGLRGNGARNRELYVVVSGRGEGMWLRGHHAASYGRTIMEVPTVAERAVRAAVVEGGNRLEGDRFTREAIAAILRAVGRGA